MKKALIFAITKAKWKRVIEEYRFTGSAKKTKRPSQGFCKELEQ